MEYHEEIKQTVTETNDRLEKTNEKLEETLDKLDKTNETFTEVRKEVISKMTDLEGKNGRRIEEVKEETAKKCEQAKQEMRQIREENQKDITVICTDIGERMEGVYNNINQIDSKVDKNKQKIDEIHDMK